MNVHERERADGLDEHLGAKKVSRAGILSIPWCELSGRLTLSMYLTLSGAVGISWLWPHLVGVRGLSFSQGGPVVVSVVGFIMLVAGIRAAFGRMRMPLIVVSCVLAGIVLTPIAARKFGWPWDAGRYGLVGYMWKHALPIAMFLWLIIRQFRRAEKARILFGAVSALLLLAFAVKLPAVAAEWGDSVGSSLVAQERVERVGIGLRIPHLQFQDLRGGAVTLEKPGTLYVVNFWATWCRPCQEELPELLTVANQHAGNEHVMVMAVNTEDLASERLSSFIEGEGLKDLPIYRDQDRWFESLGMRTVPVTLLVRDRQVVARYDGYSRGSIARIEAAIRDHLKDDGTGG